MKMLYNTDQQPHLSNIQQDILFDSTQVGGTGSSLTPPPQL